MNTALLIWDTRDQIANIDTQLANRLLYLTELGVSDLSTEFDRPGCKMMISRSAKDLICQAAVWDCDAAVLFAAGTMLCDTQHFFLNFMQSMGRGTEIMTTHGHKHCWIVNQTVLQQLVDTDADTVLSSIDRWAQQQDISVHNLPQEGLFYSNHQLDPQAFIHALDLSVAALHDAELDLEQKRWLLQLRYCQEDHRGFWAYNTDPNDIAGSLSTDCLITVASGLLPWLHMVRCVQAGGRVLFIDRNANCIRWQQYLHSMLPSISDYDSVVADFAAQHDLSIMGHNDARYAQQFGQALLEIQSNWDHIQSLDIGFQEGDIIHLPENVVQDMRTSRQPYVWFSNVFRYIATADRCYSSDDFAAYLTRLLQANINTSWRGSSMTYDDCQGPRSAATHDTKFFRVHDDVGLPVAAAMQEIAELERLGLFTSHRSGDGLHRGWSSFVLHGLGYDKTSGYEHYGYASDAVTPYAWTAEAVRHCPSLVQWFQQKQFRERYHRVRIMRLAPWGMVGLHNDNEENDNVWADNMAINNPPGCEMHFWDRQYRYLGQVPWADGKAIKIRIGMNHCVINRSDQVRYHLIMHGRGGWL
jgi:hypothetical protein